MHTEHVVTTGNHAQTTANLLNLKLPAIPVEHQFIVTDEDPKLIAFPAMNPEHPVLRDADANGTSAKSEVVDTWTIRKKCSCKI